MQVQGRTPKPRTVKDKIVDALIASGAFFLLFLMGVGIESCNTRVVRTGEFTGTITMIGESGLFCKTNEVQFVIHNPPGTGLELRLYSITVNDPGLLAEANKYLHSQQLVDVTFTGYMNVPCASDSGGDFINSIKPAN